MEKIWLKSYPSGVPAELPEPAYRSIRDMVEQGYREFPERES